MTMNCPYCRTVNDVAESRCARCGRRLHGAPPRSGSEIASGTGSAATAYAFQAEPETQDAPDPEVAPAARVENKPVDFQPSLFREVAGGPKVVPIPTLSPLRPSSRLERERTQRSPMRAVNRKMAAESQQRLELDAPQDTLPAAEETLFCDARVALPTQRTMAAVADGAAVVLGAGVFLGVAAFAGVQLSIGDSLLLLPAAMIAVVAILYRGMWCLLNRDTPGMRFAGLRLVDFDGRAPRRERRIVRQFSGLLSLLSAGVGLAWALVDEESLTWHDHISRTFPTTV